MKKEIEEKIAKEQWRESVNARCENCGRFKYGCNCPDEKEEGK